MVWEIPVQPKIKWNDFNRQPLEYNGNYLACHAVSRINCNFQLFYFSGIYEFFDMLGVICKNIFLDYLSALFWLNEPVFFNEFFYCLQPCILIYRDCICLRKFHAVVVLGI